MSYTLRNLLIAAALGFVGIILTTSYIKSQRAQLERGKQEVRVLVAKKDIPAGTAANVLEEGGYVEEEKVLREDAPPRALHNVKDVAKLSVNETVYQGEVLTFHKFETRSGLNPTEQIKGSQRIMAIPISTQGSVAKFIKPGDHVDISASSDKVGMSHEQLKRLGKKFAFVHGTNIVTWTVARDVTVLQTPESLKPKTGEDAPPEELNVKADPQIYVLQVPDNVVADIQYAYNAAKKFDQDTLLWLSLRPSNGATDTDIDATVAIPDDL